LKKRVSLILLVLVLVVPMAAFTACGGEETSTPTPTTPTPTPTPTPTTLAPTPSSTELPPSSYLPEVPRISVEEVKAKLDAGSKIVIVDSRSHAGYEQSHIVGAISLPLGNMSEPYSDLNDYDEIFIY